ncbi:hypothetical protein NUH87_23580 [Pseudomonas batumici]|uniref:OB-fold protein n=1 Tax=Pseudomonas batumici TaxID=226910 RepID=UPI0030D51C29
MKKLFKWVGIVLGCLIAISLISNAMKSPEQKQADAAAREQKQAQQAAADQAQAQAAQDKAKQEVAAMPAVTAKAIAVAYNENTVAADQQFKGKKFKVSGTVADISTNFMGAPYLTLVGGVNQFMEPQFAFEKEDAPKLAPLKKGAKVTLLCVGKGDVAKIPMSDSCILL